MKINTKLKIKFAFPSDLGFDPIPDWKLEKDQFAHLKYFNKYDTELEKKK